MKRFQRKILTTSSRLAEKGIKEVSGITAGVAGAGIGMLVGVLSQGVAVPIGIEKGFKIGKAIGRKGGGLIANVGGRVLRKSKDFNNLLFNPLDELSNSLIRFIVDLFGFSFGLENFIADALIKNKSQIALFLTSFILIITMSIYSYIYQSSVFAFGTSIFLTDYEQLDYPSGSPFGGIGSEYTTVTAEFNDIGYFERFNKWHKAIDIVPSGQYYTSEIYLKHKEILIFSTCSGNGRTYVDNLGGITVEVICDDNNYKILFVHMSKVFLKQNEAQHLLRGEAIGIMGCSGYCFGDHVHYATYIKEGNEYVPFDPLPTITL